jgi:hypothetical protein
MVESAQAKLFGRMIMLGVSMVSFASRGGNMKRIEDMPIALTIPIILLSFIIMTTVISFPYANAFTENDTKVVEIDVKSPFRGDDGEIKLMGVVHNTGGIPLGVKLGVDVTTTTTTKDATETTVTEETVPYSRVLYPYSVSPFKFSIKSADPENQTTVTGIGKPHVIDFEKVSTPNYDGLIILNYTNIPYGENAALVGTVKNSGPFELRDVAVYASAHDQNRKQVDSVKSTVIKALEPGQEMAFTAIPDPSSKSQIMYYSCAGVVMNPQMSKLIISDKKVVRYDLEGPVAISDLKYDNASDSMLFGVKHYNPDGGPLTIKVASNEYSGSQNPLSIILDGKDLSLDKTTMSDNGMILTMNIEIPPKEHEVHIRGISNLLS